ncbi:MAG: hypothetical protein OEV92_07265 [Nitrospinota bacterium]|nr:hypothetical protein [Nitrospinota bacterium]
MNEPPDSLNNVDVFARAKLSFYISQFANGRITSHQFDDALEDIKDQTADRTAHTVAGQLWFLYDDMEEHNFRGGKAVWDYMQRLRMILESGGEYTIEYAPRSAWRRVSAILLLLGLCCIYYFFFEIGPEVFLCAMLALAGVSSALFIPERDTLNAPIRNNPKLGPFASIKEIALFRRKASRFVKMKYCERQPERPRKFWRPILEDQDLAELFRGTALEPLASLVGSAGLAFLNLIVLPLLLLGYAIGKGDKFIKVTPPGQS